MKPWVTVGLSTVQPIEWLFVVLLGVMALGTVGFLLFSYFHRYLDDLDCSKYEIFDTTGQTVPPNTNGEIPTPPLICRLRYLESKALWQPPGVNTMWIWMTLGLILAWATIVTVAFMAGHGMTVHFEGWRRTTAAP
jgi:hypothetical protein